MNIKLNTKPTPLVSTIIPTYNHADYLGKALQSVLNQTYDNFEVLVIDGNSNDNTTEVVNKFKDSRIKYFKIPNYGIIATSRNMGIRASSGEWIAFLDADDWWSKDKLKICMEHSNNEVDLVYHDLKIVSQKPSFFVRRKTRTRQLRKPVLIDLLLGGNIIPNSSVVVRKEMLEKIGFIDESKELVASEDYNTWLKISKFTDRFLYLPKSLGYYFINNQNISKKDMSATYRKATDKFLSDLSSAQKIKLEANYKYISARYDFLQSNFKKSKNNLLFVLKNGSLELKIKSLLMFLLIIISLK